MRLSTIKFAIAASVAALAAASSPAALLVTGTVDGSAVTFTTTSFAPGWVNYFGTLNGITITADLSGYPMLASPQFTTSTFQVSSGAATGTHNVVINAFQTGLPGTFTDLLATATLNTVTGGVSESVSGYSGAKLLSTLTNGPAKGTNGSTVQVGNAAASDQTVTYTFSFTGASQTASGSYQIAAVPEAATWAMMVAGFGAIGAALRTGRRQRALTA